MNRRTRGFAVPSKREAVSLSSTSSRSRFFAARLRSLLARFASLASSRLRRSSSSSRFALARSSRRLSTSPRVMNPNPCSSSNAALRARSNPPANSSSSLSSLAAPPKRSATNLDVFRILRLRSLSLPNVLCVGDALPPSSSYSSPARSHGLRRLDLSPSSPSSPTSESPRPRASSHRASSSSDAIPRSAPSNRSLSDIVADASPASEDVSERPSARPLAQHFMVDRVALE